MFQNTLCGQSNSRHWTGDQSEDTRWWGLRNHQYEEDEFNITMLLLLVGRVRKNPNAYIARIYIAPQSSHHSLDINGRLREVTDASASFAPLDDQCR